MSSLDAKGKWVVLGVAGQLGQAFVRELAARGESFIALGLEDADLSKPEELRLPLDDARAVINCAAYTNVDGAEADEATATTINGVAVEKLAELCKKADIPLVHFSTDYVFDGHGNEPLSVDQSRAPLNAYGRSKARGEEALERSGADFLLVRTSWVYAPWGNNFVKTMARLMSEKEELRVVDDQRGRPTHAVGLAQRSLALLEKGERGIFHVTDEGECTWYGFAKAIAEAIGSSCRIVPCTTDEFPRPAPRPVYGVLGCERADRLLGPARHYKEWLSDMAPQLK